MLKAIVLAHEEDLVLLLWAVYGYRENIDGWTFKMVVDLHIWAVKTGSGPELISVRRCLVL